MNGTGLYSPVNSVNPVNPAGSQAQPLPRERAPKQAPYNKQTHKRCLKCREVKPRTREHYGSHKDQPDGLQSYCQECKKKLGEQRQRNNLVAYLKHHMATRIKSQLQGYAPKGYTKDLEFYLGYKIKTLIKHLRQRLHEDTPQHKSLKTAIIQEGYHVDHIRPLSSFRVIVDNAVDWEAFKACWAIENLKAIPAKENLAKGSTWHPTTPTTKHPKTTQRQAKSTERSSQ